PRYPGNDLGNKASPHHAPGTPASPATPGPAPNRLVDRGDHADRADLDRGGFPLGVRNPGLARRRTASRSTCPGPGLQRGDLARAALPGTGVARRSLGALRLLPLAAVSRPEHLDRSGGAATDLATATLGPGSSSRAKARRDP